MDTDSDFNKRDFQFSDEVQDIIQMVDDYSDEIERKKANDKELRNKKKSLDSAKSQIDDYKNSSSSEDEPHYKRSYDRKKENNPRSQFRKQLNDEKEFKRSVKVKSIESKYKNKQTKGSVDKDDDGDGFKRELGYYKKTKENVKTGDNFSSRGEYKNYKLHDRKIEKKDGIRFEKEFKDRREYKHNSKLRNGNPNDKFKEKSNSENETKGKNYRFLKNDKEDITEYSKKNYSAIPKLNNKSDHMKYKEDKKGQNFKNFFKALTKDGTDSESDSINKTKYNNLKKSKESIFNDKSEGRKDTNYKKAQLKHSSSEGEYDRKPYNKQITNSNDKRFRSEFDDHSDYFRKPKSSRDYSPKNELKKKEKNKDITKNKLITESDLSDLSDDYSDDNDDGDDDEDDDDEDGNDYEDDDDNEYDDNNYYDKKFKKNDGYHINKKFNKKFNKKISYDSERESNSDATPQRLVKLKINPYTNNNSSSSNEKSDSESKQVTSKRDIYKEQFESETGLNLVRKPEWGAPATKWGRGPGMKCPVPNVFILSTDKRYCRSKEACCREMLFLANRHMNTQLCPDIKYNFMIGGDGRVYEGRGWVTRPGLPKDYQTMNKESLFIALAGKHDEYTVPSEMKDAKQKLIKYGIRHYYIDDKYTLHSSVD